MSSLTRGGEMLLEESVGLAFALILGGVLARGLRRHGMHWSWSAGALAPALLLDRLHAPAGQQALIALALATFRGARMHREDLETGQDLALAARQRRTPGTVFRSWIAGPLPSGLLGRLEGGLLRSGRTRARSEQVLMLGRERDGRAVSIPFASGTAGHTLVVGATGSGKTVTQTLLGVRAIEQGRGAIVLDPKGDASLRERLRAAAELAGREFLEWTPSGPTAYNPYARGGETEIADRLLVGERFTEPHYLRQAQRYLGHAVRALRAGEVEVSLATTARALDPVALDELLRRLPEERARAGHAYLDSLTARQLLDLAGVRDRLAILAESDAGRWLEPAEAARRNLDLLAAVHARAVVYFALETDTRPLLAQMLGAAIVGDLQSAVAALQASPIPTLVAIDEFSAISADHVVALFGRARSAGFSLLLGTQELTDLRLPGRERTLEQVMGNLSLLIAHRQVVPASAELLSRLSGTRGAWRASWSSTGRSSRTRQVEQRLTAEALMALTPGWAAVIAFGSHGRARVARIESPAVERR